VVALGYVAAAHDPTRFAVSKGRGACARRHSGETEAADARAQIALFEPAHVIMARVARSFRLKALGHSAIRGGGTPRAKRSKRSRSHPGSR
jgi:hypothetical protein